MENKALNYLSLARKGGMAELGEEPVGAIARTGKAYVILVASDASDHTWRRAKSFAAGTEQQCVRLECTKDEMGLSANNAVNVKKVNAVYCIENGVLGFKFTGITPGYTNVSLFLPANSGAVDNYGEATYWTATPVGSNQAGYQLSLTGDGNYKVNCYYAAFGNNDPSYVRPVLDEK